ncbi:amidase [Stappia stellulata]|uniref:amidase n=1 Tax=Stappia stellulata TaxID=71235 RepID=UPI001CD34BED|nr:amidase [Stappia stellulata]MCA1241486.1 amidase [Stappia stellulata]
MMEREDITPETVAAAEPLAGVDFSDAERAQIAVLMPQQKEATRRLRALGIGNGVPMACRFDPRLPGFRMPDLADTQVYSAIDPGPLPADPADIAFAPVTRLSAWLASGAIDSAGLTEIYLDRIDRIAPMLRCMAAVTADLAREQAAMADARRARGDIPGPLLGVPYVLKDLFDTKGIVTGWGAEPYRDRIPEEDAALVSRMREAGAVLLGKSSLGALARNDVWYGGRTNNPWNLNEGSSGSSAGSASATAAGLCGFSIGTETLGSIMSPSQRCGTTGLRPTFGRVSRRGAMVLAATLDKVGPICRAVEDTAMVLSALNGVDPDDRGSISAPFHFDANARIDDLRVGYLPEAFGDGATATDRRALETVRGLGCTVVETALPDLPYDALRHILIAEAAANFEDLTFSDRDELLTVQTDEAWPNTFRRARFLSAPDHVQLDKLRYLTMQALDALFRDVDVLIGPLSTGPMMVASNFTGHPCLHLRAGFEERPNRPPSGPDRPAEPGEPLHTVPMGISLWSGLFREDRILSLGLALERAFDVADRRPPAAGPA